MAASLGRFWSTSAVTASEVLPFGTAWTRKLPMVSMQCRDLAACSTRSIFISVSQSRPYPLFTSQVVVPQRIMLSKRLNRISSSVSAGAARVAVTVLLMPPPAACTSSYEAPASFMACS